MINDGIRMVGGRRMQCKDIPAAVFLDSVRAAGRRVSMAWDTHAALEERIGSVPWNLFLSRARKLIDAGLLGGCACGCRGDFTVLADDHDWNCDQDGRTCSRCGLPFKDWYHVRCPGPPKEPTSLVMARLLERLS